MKTPSIPFRLQFPSLAALAVALPLAVSVPASGALITEYFNNYGTSNLDLPTLGTATDGWGGAWTGSNNVDYQANNQLTFTSSGYSTFGNETDTNDGRANRGGTGVATRAFDSTFSLGTVWVTGLISSTGATGMTSTPGPETVPDRDTRLQLSGSLNSVVFGEDNAKPYLNAGGGALTFGNPGINEAAKELNASGTYLLLIKIDLTAGNDTIQLWVGNDDSGGAKDFGVDLSSQTEAGLGAALLTSSSTDLGSISGFGINFNKQGQADILRFSTTAGDAGLQEVLTGMAAVPEPSSFALLIAGGVGVLAMRRRRRS